MLKHHSASSRSHSSSYLLVLSQAPWPMYFLVTTAAAAFRFISLTVTQYPHTWAYSLIIIHYSLSSSQSYGHALLRHLPAQVA